MFVKVPSVFMIANVDCSGLHASMATEPMQLKLPFSWVAPQVEAVPANVSIPLHNQPVILPS